MTLIKKLKFKHRSIKILIHCRFFSFTTHLKSCAYRVSNFHIHIFNLYKKSSQDRHVSPLLLDLLAKTEMIGKDAHFNPDCL